MFSGSPCEISTYSKGPGDCQGSAAWRLPGIAPARHRSPAEPEVGIVSPRSGFRLRSTPRSEFRLRSFCPKNPSPGQRRRSVSAPAPRHTAVGVFLPLTPCRQSWREHSWQQDCFNHSCADSRIAPVHYKQLGLGTVLARAQACDGVGPAVELPAAPPARHRSPRQGRDSCQEKNVEVVV